MRLYEVAENDKKLRDEVQDESWLKWGGDAVKSIGKAVRGVGKKGTNRPGMQKVASHPDELEDKKPFWKKMLGK